MDLALAVGSLVGIANIPLKPVRAVATAYEELFRNVPLLVQIFLFYFVLPEVLPPSAGRWLKRELPEPEFGLRW